MTIEQHLTPKGFDFAVAAAGFRAADRNDIGLVLSATPAVAAGVFTQNLFPAAPVVVCRERLAASPTVRGVLINSGQANACTGEEGMTHCHEALALAAAAVKADVDALLPASTGVIGPQLKMDLWEQAVPQLAETLGKSSPEDFTRAIMTTDAFPKIASRTINLGGFLGFGKSEVRILGMAKGAGMICPNMATMLCVVVCDAVVAPSDWQKILTAGVNETFNRVTVDGDTSTNDTLIALANGASGYKPEGESLVALQKALTEVLGDLAYMLVQDGEGSTKVARIEVTGAATAADAEQVARTVGHSQLVKTALYGRDGNWGRIVAAAGRAGVSFDPLALRVTLCEVEVFRDGQPTAADFDARLAEPLQRRDIPIQISLGSGPGAYTLLASDLGHEYVDCNASYRS